MSNTKDHKKKQAILLREVGDKFSLHAPCFVDLKDRPKISQ